MDVELSGFKKFLANKGAKTAVLITVFFAVMFSLASKAPTEIPVTDLPKIKTNQPLGAFPVTVPTIKFGMALDTFQTVVTREIKNGDFFGKILSDAGVAYPDVEKIVANCDSVFNVKQFRVGKKYTLLAKDTTAGFDKFIYEPSIYGYYTFDLKNDFSVTKTEKPVLIQTATAKGEIESSLWNAMTDNGLSYELAAEMENALQWSIDFHHLQKGDEFRVVYDQEFIEGAQVGAGKVHAARYKTGNNTYYAYYFDHPEHGGYYDEEGRPMDKGFLKSPVKYSRISSGFNMNRFHPVLKRRRPHLGTDYAAPYGTPILAVGDGVVTEATRRGGNGNFVKIKHDKTYQTQYLHMQKFAKGIAPGVHVRQGQVIGYVGSTGLATGPHVCFRFWKNGKQVNHRALEFPPPAPLPEEFLPDFKTARDLYVEKLNAL